MILYAILAAGFLALLGGIYGKGRIDGHAAQKEEDAPIIAQAKSRADTAEAGNASLQRGLATRDDVIRRNNAELERLAKIRGDAMAAVAAANAASVTRAKAIEGKLDAFLTGSTANTPPELQCERARATLGDLADLMREGLPAANPGPVGASKPAEVSRVPAAVAPPAASPQFARDELKRRAGQALPPAVKVPR